MNRVLSSLGCLVALREPRETTGKTTTRREAGGVSCTRDDSGTDVPYRILPHFHEETKAYLRGNTDVLDRLPAVKATALERANRSVPQMPLGTTEAQGNAGSARLRAATFARLRERWREARGGVLHASGATGQPTSRRRARGAAPSAAGLADHKPQSIESRNLNTATLVTPGRYPVYDGLRSSPPFAGAHSWKLYTGPCFDTQSPRKSKKKSSLENLESEIEQPSPRLELVTKARGDRKRGATR
ncbi:hypothetical protein MYCTH_2123045 [Thermothelomyces thermophilus ATCC 42464]|uniref:Uncharacterized protein n=1 Tax=Thermothelomyces thermophilus (strain ATCC 42464 / BCRC 31852 / DSM 1799) TaxID=573729 RepID=G2Q1H9_THET4|nr:uncharacterized protein MYCTH_2123045 [Thermothelomyces thermophilus ATCC 42464]AEO54169.1 hypothetical protein MYCTH_2123045 [Thermothelomyces thermophilus ATCC 42464]